MDEKHQKQQLAGLVLILHCNTGHTVRSSGEKRKRSLDVVEMRRCICGYYIFIDRWI